MLSYFNYAHSGMGFGQVLTRRERKAARKAKRALPSGVATAATVAVTCTAESTLGACFQCCSRLFTGRTRRQCKRDCAAAFPGTPTDGEPKGGCLRGRCPANYCDTGTECCPDPAISTIRAVPCILINGGCRSDADCPSGRCVGGRCVALEPDETCGLTCISTTGGQICRYVCNEPSSPIPREYLPVPEGVPWVRGSGVFQEYGAETVEDAGGGIIDKLKENWLWLVGGAAALWYLKKNKRSAAA